MSPQKRTTSWSTPTTLDEVARRAGGRARWNALRRDLMVIRRRDLASEMAGRALDRGDQARLAERFGVSPSTISRDVRSIFSSVAACRCCGQITRS